MENKMTKTFKWVSEFLNFKLMRHWFDAYWDIFNYSNDEIIADWKTIYFQLDEKLEYGECYLLSIEPHWIEIFNFR